MDEFLALLDESVEAETASAPSEEADLESETRHRRTKPPERRRREISTAQRIAASADDRIGVRMINRKVSGLDLMNMISDRPYHSPAQLSAYSLVCLNKLLVDPAIVIDPASVCGRTELITAGIVLTNSGTRLSASGNAFCVVTVGNFKTGPCLSLLLFGESYGTHCRTCSPGKVVAIINPRLIPPKNSGTFDRTSVSFSVSEEPQLVIVADARDYGMCKGMTRAKNEHGQWVSNGKPCQNYIDKRLGEYCAHHQKQAAVAGSGQNPSQSTKAGSSLQQVRTQSSAFAASISNQSRPLQANNMTKNSKVEQPLSTSRPAGRPQQTQQSQIFKRGPGTTLPSQPTANKIFNKSLVNPPVFQDVSTTQRPTSARPIRPIGNSSSVVKHGNGGLPGRLLTKVAERPPLRSSPLRSSTGNHLVARNIFELPKPKTNDLKRKQVINMDTPGFQGSVKVPAPSRMFRQRDGTTAAGQVSYRMVQPLTKSLKSAESVREQQQIVATRLEERTAKVGTTGLSARRLDKQTTSPSPLDDLFAPLDENSRNQILSAKSRFATEADAEEYARSRRVVNELEEQEAKKSKRVKDVENSIEKEWFCHTCNQTYRAKPVTCLRSDHRVKVERKIRATQTIEEQRIKLTEKNVEDGGLVLGKGLEWSAR